MKYIRTKDGIFPCLDTYTLKVGDLIDINEPILAKADTIEELCDEFVSIRKDDIKFLADIIKAKHGRTLALKTDLFIWRKPLIKSLKKEFQVYGAIWTDKGLIYVAKMNSEGVLELL